MLKIDAHQHFWKFDPVRDSWITDEMRLLKKDYLPQDLQPVLNANGFDGCIVVQSDQSLKENSFQLTNSENFDFVKGVVGWTDLQSDSLEERLEYYSQFKKFKGFRHVLQCESQRDFMLRPDFLKGISLLRKYGFTYDILIFPDQLNFVKKLVAAFPDQRFVINHLAKPYIKDKILEKWRTEILALAEHCNVFCKISGMVTEAAWNNWILTDFDPYLDVVIQGFGTERVMFGSDWPVCMLSASYSEVYKITKRYFSSYSIPEQEKIFGGNAIDFYSL